MLEGYSSAATESGTLGSLDTYLKEIVSPPVISESSIEAIEWKLQMVMKASYAPELEPDDIVERMMKALAHILHVERFGLFQYTPDRKKMVLRITEGSRGFTLPISGLAGHCLQTGEILNIPDAYKDKRFNSNMDKETGYLTREVLCIPIKSPESGNIIGTIQCVNRTCEIESFGFTKEECQLVEQASKLLAHPLDQIFKGATLQYSSNCTRPFEFKFKNFNMTQKMTRTHLKASLYHGRQLLETKSEIPSNEWISFDSEICNLPQGTRIVFQVYSKKIPIAWGGRYLYGLDNKICSGDESLMFFDGEYNSNEATYSFSDPPDDNSIVMNVEWPYNEVIPKNSNDDIIIRTSDS